MGVGQLSESDAVDALRLPFYSSSHPTGSHGWRNQFDLGNPELTVPRSPKWGGVSAAQKSMDTSPVITRASPSDAVLQTWYLSGSVSERPLLLFFSCSPGSVSLSVS